MKTEAMELLDAAQASELTGIPRSTLHLWAAARDSGEPVDGPPHFRISPRRRMWSRDDLLAWLESRRIS
ncbi:helix-turn-helix transcriptional regulator [Arthrobacter rhombi]|uniref:helix-turn-helix transcriptional regulator n=1 Tax=Arthrobacter rhombi TaxID=71253 RepID=UPI003FD67171